MSHPTNEAPDTICPAATRIKRGVEPHTVRCQLPAGHEGGHTHKKDSRETIWFGEATTPDYSNRFRFGAWIMDH